MENSKPTGVRLGWAGLGRMGAALVGRLLDAGFDVAVYNRTRAKAEPFAAQGATVVDSPAELADRDIVFTMVAGPDDFTGGRARDAVRGRRAARVVDLTTVSPEASAAVREEAAAAAPRCSPRRSAGTRRSSPPAADARGLRARGRLQRGAARCSSASGRASRTSARASAPGSRRSATTCCSGSSRRTSPRSSCSPRRAACRAPRSWSS